MIWMSLALPLAWAQQPPASELEAQEEQQQSSADTDTDTRLAVLEAEVTELQAALEAQTQAALLAEAEALANTAPPAPPPPPASKNAFNPSITAFGDMIGTLGLDDGEVMPGSGPWLRSLELDLRADVDPFAKAYAVIALHQDPPYGSHDHGGGDEHDHDHDHGHDEEVEEAEEAEVDSHTGFIVVPEEVVLEFVALPGGLSAQVGQFRQPFGVTNRSHPHDLPWTDTPLPIEEFLGHEGYTDAGGLLRWRPPNTVTGITMQGGLLRGALFDPDDEVAMPQWLGRLEWFHQAGTIDWGLGVSGTGDDADLVGGADLLLRWRQNSWRSVILLGELLTDGDELGGYGALQLQPTRPLFIGLRADWMGDEHRLAAYVSTYTSEFLRIRAGATRQDDMTLMHLQATFVWGSHPVEPYWVNR